MGCREVSAVQASPLASVWLGPVIGYMLATGIVSGEDYEEVDRYNRQGRASRASGRGAQQNRRGSWRYKRWEDLYATNIFQVPPLRQWQWPKAGLGTSMETLSFWHLVCWEWQPGFQCPQ